MAGRYFVCIDKEMFYGQLSENPSAEALNHMNSVIVTRVCCDTAAVIKCV